MSVPTFQAIGGVHQHGLGLLPLTNREMRTRHQDAQGQTQL